MGYSPGRQKPNVVSSTGKMAALKVFFSSSTTADGGVGGTEFRKGGRGAGRGEKKGGEEGRKLGGGGNKRLEAGRLFGTFQVAGKMPPQPHPATVLFLLSAIISITSQDLASMIHITRVTRVLMLQSCQWGTTIICSHFKQTT